MKPTYDELIKIVKEQRKTIERLEKRVQELEEQLNLNSKNTQSLLQQIKRKTSKPPRVEQKKDMRVIFGNFCPKRKSQNELFLH